jgi:hypothetical protein
LLQKCVERVGSITVLDAKERVEKEERYERAVGYETLVVKLNGR